MEIPDVQHQPHLADYVGLCIGEWLPPLPGIPENFLHKISLSFFKFSKKTKKIIEKILSQFENWNSREFISIHIRKGDKVLGPDKEGEDMTIEQYINNVEKVRFYKI